jgi:hypothetical protein
MSETALMQVGPDFNRHIARFFDYLRGLINMAVWHRVEDQAKDLRNRSCQSLSSTSQEIMNSLSDSETPLCASE